MGTPGRAAGEVLELTRGDSEGKAREPSAGSAGPPPVEVPAIGSEEQAAHATGPAASTYDSVARSVTRSGLWSLGGQAVTFAVVLVATPFTIRLLGRARYGLWAILQSALTWVTLADLGMAEASTRFGGESLARGDATGEARTVWTAAAITVSVTTLAAGGIAVAAPFVLSDLLHVRGVLLGPGITALRIVCAVFVAQAISGTLNTPQIIRLRWRSYTIVTTGSSVLQVVAVPVALAAVAGGVLTAAAVSLGAAAVGALGTVWVAVRLQPAIMRPKVDGRMARKLLRFGGPLTLSGLAAIPLTTAERLLLAHYTSPSTVAYYVVAAALAGVLSVIPAAVAAPMFPALVALEGAGQSASARSLYRQALQGAFLVLTPAVLLLAFVAHPFIALWAGSAYGRHSTGLFYVLLIGIWFNGLAYIPLSYLLASSRTALIARIHLLELVPYIVIGAVLTSTLGALGAAIVWSARVVIDSVVLFWCATRAGQLPLSPLSSRALASAASPLALAAALALVGLVVSGLAARVAYALVLLLIYGGVMWLLVLTRRERAMVRSLVARVTPF